MGRRERSTLNVQRSTLKWEIGNWKTERMETMKERPILFSAPMVLAILALIKRMTRRTSGLDHVNREPDAWTVVANKGGGEWLFRRVDSCTFATARCPYGVPGDRLWVRETFGVCTLVDGRKLYEGLKVYYKSTGASKDGTPAKEFPEYPVARWRPSIHMPRWASRITLEVTGVRVERLQEITEEDAVAEGVKPETREKAYTIVCRGGGTFEVSSLHERGVPAVGDASPFGEVTHVEPIPEKVLMSAREVFRLLWMKINGRASWYANPWVWVVEFRRVE